jgi:pimeloyl-ACP methyl ester carboxylesterase
VFLHGGFGFDSRLWEPQLEVLANEFTVVAWDAPGTGRSSDPPESFRMPEYADCLAAFVAALGLDRPHIVGLSLGATLAIQLYDRHPTIPRTLVLAGAYAGWAGSLPAEVVEQRLRKLLEENERPPAEWAPAYVPGMLTNAAPQAMVDHVLALMCDVRPAGNRPMLHAMAEADLRDVLPRIAVPTLLLYGDADQRSPLHVGEALHAQIPTSTLVVLPGVGHLSNLEAADRFNSAVRAFIRTHS